MRLDLFLKISRLVKRRIQARELCESGRVLVNGRPAKPGREVNPGDILTVRFISRSLDVEIVKSPISSRKPTPDEVYRVKSEDCLPGNAEPWTKDQSSS